jgi:hypothetical protein
MRRAVQVAFESKGVRNQEIAFTWFQGLKPGAFKLWVGVNCIQLVRCEQGVKERESGVKYGRPTYEAEDGDPQVGFQDIPLRYRQLPVALQRPLCSAAGCI